MFEVLEFGESPDKEREVFRLKEKKLMETEELNFLLQSGIVLCKLAAIIVPGADIAVDQLQVANLKYFIYWFLNIPQTGNLSTKKKNIHLFLKCAGKYGVPEKYLFKPDDLVVQAHFYK